jgi:hypothetical protein
LDIRPQKKRRFPEGLARKKTAFSRKYPFFARKMNLTYPLHSWKLTPLSTLTKGIRGLNLEINYLNYFKIGS